VLLVLVLLLLPGVQSRHYSRQPCTVAQLMRPSWVQACGMRRIVGAAANAAQAFCIMMPVHDAHAHLCDC